jgi:hypothetical protein
MIYGDASVVSSWNASDSWNEIDLWISSDDHGDVGRRVIAISSDFSCVFDSRLDRPIVRRRRSRHFDCGLGHVDFLTDF